MANSAPWMIDCVVGARPNFVKIAPILRALNAHGHFTARLIHPGQHYDVATNAVFFEELAIPERHINLEIGSDTNTGQTAQIMMGMEKVFNENRPSMLVVAGDVNSTLAATKFSAATAPSAERIANFKSLHTYMRYNDRGVVDYGK